MFAFTCPYYPRLQLYISKANGTTITPATSDIFITLFLFHNVHFLRTLLLFVWNSRSFRDSLDNHSTASEPALPGLRGNPGVCDAISIVA